jgi:hypothetical protein
MAGTVAVARGADRRFEKMTPVWLVAWSLAWALGWSLAWILGWASATYVKVAEDADAFRLDVYVIIPPR